MAIIHGNWLLQPQGGCFFIWGETWRRITTQDAFQIGDDLHHPLAMTAMELKTFFDTLQQAGKLNWQIPGDRTHAANDRGTQKRKTGKAKATQTQVTVIQPTEASPRWQNCAIALPTTHAGEQLIPQHSAVSLDNPDLDLSLYPWQVEGFCLTPTEAFTFLQALPLGTVADASDRAPGSGWEWLGSDLQFWSHITRWSLDLLARGKFLPALERQSNGFFGAKWQLLLDSATDRNRLTTFARQMPAACRTYQSLGQPVLSTTPAIDLPPLPQDLLQGFLSAIVDSQVRAASQSLIEIKVASPVREWFASLGQADDRVTADAEMLDRLETSLTSWTAPLQNQLSHNQFRTAFHLIPPTSTQNQWSLAYYLQAIDDPDCLVSAKTIWNNPVENLVYQNRSIQFPQETLLSGLGLASKLYPLIEPSLQEQRPQSCSLTPLQAYEFLKSVAWRFSDSGLGIILPPSLANREGWASRLGLSIQAEAPTLGKISKQRLGLQSLLNFKWELTIGGQRISKSEFDRLVAKNSPLVEIKGEWVELRPQDVKAAQNFFASRQDQMTLSLEDALRLASGDTQTVEKLPVVNFEASGQLQELLNNLTNNQAVGAIVTPANFQGELRPYQARGVGWLAFLEKWGLGACLADDMGLGKTPQLIAFLLHLQDQDALESPTLVICPTSVLGNWEREVKKFGPTLKTFVYHGDRRPKGKAFATAIKGKNLVITSYPLVYRDAKELQGVKWQGVVLDEAQNIKNSEAKQSQAVRQLEASFKIALTGTPVENRLQELWSILDFLNPSYLGPRNFFQRRFAIPIEKYGDKESLQTLRSLVRPFILRRLKTDKEIIQDLPEKQEMTIFCPLSSEQASLYQKTVEESLVDIESSAGIQRRGMILALLIKLKQICNHPSQFLKDKTLASHLRSGKLQRLEAMVEELLAEGDRALIFTQFAEWGHLLKPYLEKQLGREILFLYGGTRQQQREEMIDRFQHDPQGPPIMILSLKAGGTGLNLTRATHVFHFDRWWNPAVENQATDRVFRIGQTRNVQVHKFVCTGTLEEKIHDMIESKKALAEQVVGAGEQWLTELDTDQLRNLLILDRNAIIEEEEE